MLFDSRILSNANNYVLNVVNRYKLFIISPNGSNIHKRRYYKNKLLTQCRMSGNIFKFFFKQNLVVSQVLSNTNNPFKAQNLQQYFAVQHIKYYQIFISHKVTYSIALSTKVSTALKALLVLIKQTRLKNIITPKVPISSSS